MKNNILIAIILLIIFGCIAYAIATNSEKTELILRANAQEDYTSEIDHLHFGDTLREAQLDMDTLYNRAEAIACAEGFNKADTIAQRNNNPGNLKARGNTDKYGHTIYESELTGWLALYKLLYKHQYKSIEQIGTFYATDPGWSRNVYSCAERA
jgi:amino acid permease